MVIAPCPCEVLAITVHPFSPTGGQPVMAIPAMILPFLASWGGEDFGGVAAAAAFGVEDSALERPLAGGGDSPADERGTRG
jgi:hypothetical protein